MRVLIETYRGWDIHFDTDSEDFYTVSNEHYKQATKRSYASTKKFIDDYIKENNEFKPIKVQKEETIFKTGDVITLIGLRKDNTFMYEDSDGKKSQLSKYSEKEYFLVDSRNDVHFDTIKQLRKKREAIDAEIREAQNRVIKVDVRQIRNNLLGLEG